ncbi:MAG: hypothetical protein KKD56_08030 [Acidobacteria bacterium]|nr:hypothetical protein [Acidobacteriota bacterium]MBU1473757.1 hypothetical protein [Acidobacteriota bacterium]
MFRRAQGHQRRHRSIRGDDSLTARVKGSGLGLSIAQKIITDHGGNIQYFSRDGGGSIFQIRLPRRQ